MVAIPRQVASMAHDPPRAVCWLVVTALCVALALLWWIGEPLPSVGQTIWLVARQGAIRAIVWIVAAAAIVSLTAAWLVGAPLRSRLLVAWMVAALVAGLAMRPQLVAIARVVLGLP